MGRGGRGVRGQWAPAAAPRRDQGLLAVSLASPLVNLVGKQAFRRNRPSAEGLPLARMIKMPTSASFPSGHSASAAAFAAAVAMEAPRAVAVPVGLLAAAVCFSRVYTGVHYPGDVLAGAGIGVVAGLATRRIWPDAGEAGHARAALTAPSVLLDPEGEGAVAVVDGSADAAAGTAETLRTALPRAEIVEVAPGADLGAAVRDAASRAKVLAVAGGDAVVNLAAQETTGAATPLLVVPTSLRGRFARALGVETAQEAVEAYHSGDLVAVDVGEVAGRRFVNSVSVGLHQALVESGERRQSRVGTWPALFWAMAEVLGPGARGRWISSWTVCPGVSGRCSWATAVTRRAVALPPDGNGWKTVCWTSVCSPPPTGCPGCGYSSACWPQG